MISPTLYFRSKSAVKILRSSKKITVFTGAGISASTGIPTFRDVGGLWTDEDIAFFGSPEAWLVDPHKCWIMYEKFRLMTSSALPTAAHWFISRLADEAQVLLFTSNVDSLHEKSAVKAKEVHGALREARCTACGKTTKLPSRNVGHPGCPSCGNWLRHDVVLWGEPTRFNSELFESAAGTDCLLIIGASGEVTDTEELSALARKSGTKIVEINPRHTPSSKNADVFVMSGADEAVQKISSFMKL
jgi:NAD-dependent deacetylase